MSRNPKRAPDKSLGNNSEKLSIKRNPVEAGSCAVAAGKEGERSTNMLSQRGKGSSVSTKVVASRDHHQRPVSNAPDTADAAKRTEEGHTPPPCESPPNATAQLEEDLNSPTPSEVFFGSNRKDMPHEGRKRGPSTTEPQGFDLSDSDEDLEGESQMMHPPSHPRLSKSANTTSPGDFERMFKS